MPMKAPIQIKADSISGFTSEDLKDLEEYIEANIKAINTKLQVFRDDKLPEMVRLYKGIPKNMEQDFPWPGAANLVIQLIGTFCDELLSRILGAIYMYDPLFSIALSGDSPDKTGEEMKRVLEKFMMDEAYDASSLDLYRVEQAFFNSAIKYGTGVVQFPWEYEIEKEVITIPGVSDLSKMEYKFADDPLVKRDSPHPKLVPLNKFGVDNRVPVLGDAEFYYNIDTLTYWQVKNLQHTSELYKGKEDILVSILNSPDRSEPAEMQREASRQNSMDTTSERGSAEWDFYRCYIKYRKGNSVFSVMAYYHLKSRKLLWAIFNPNPKNLFPVEDAKLGYDDEGYFGTGYAQMLRAYQTELSNNSNWRTNNRNFGMMGIFRVDPDSKLSSILQMYPGVMVPAKDGQIERITAGADVGYSNEPDQFIMSCAKERAGVDPAIGGTGGGLVNNKRGIYSSSGTSMMLMQQNNRNNLRMSDMRSAHVRLAIKLLMMYSNIGIGKKLQKYGDNAETLKNAFKAYNDGSLGFRLRPTTASNNKELERQNDILLAGALERFYQQNAQMIQAITQPNMPEPLKKYYSDALLANVALYKTILRNFNHDDAGRLLPAIPELQPQPQPGGLNNGPTQGSGPGAGQNIGAVPFGGFQTTGSVPQ